MTKNPYSSAEIGPLMRDVKNKICHQLDLLGLLEDDYGMELLVAGNIISLDLSIAQVYEQVWKKSNQSSNSLANTTLLSSNAAASGRDCPPMTVTYRLQVCYDFCNLLTYWRITHATSFFLRYLILSFDVLCFPFCLL